MALLRLLGDLKMSMLMTFNTPEVVHKDIVLLVCSSQFRCCNDEELSLFPQIIDCEVYDVYSSSPRISYAPIGCSHCD